MNRPSEDEAAWRAIVDNYGARAELDDDVPGQAPADRADTSTTPQGAAYDVPRGPAAPRGDAERDDPAAGGEPDTATPTDRADPADRVDEADDPFPSEDLAEPAVDLDARRAAAEQAELSERFVPPTPPPLGYVAPPRLAAWIGVLGVPMLLIGLLVFGAPPPSWLTALMVVWFLGGFGYLVASMPTQRSDPGDDGARL